MKIVHVIPAFYPTRVYGGPSDSVYQLCRCLAKQAQVRVLTTNANGRNAVLDVDTGREVGIGEGVDVRYCHRIAGHTIAPRLVRLLPSYVEWADVVHLTAVYSFPTIPTLGMCRALGKPVVWSPRGALQRWAGSTKLPAKALWEASCRLVAPSKLVLHATSEEEAEASVARLAGYEVSIVPNGVEIPSRVWRIEGKGVLRLVYLGRLHPIKGIENLLLGCNLLNNNGFRAWSLVIAGAGDVQYITRLKAQVRQLGLEAQVRFAGEVRREAREELLAAADLVVVPSYTENFGRVIGEALASGVPVIASKRTPWKRIEEVGCGFWVENDARSLAAGIEQASRLPLHRLGDRGRAWMIEEFSWEKRAQEMLALYRDLTNDSRN
jgi:glycosyltransferase involved in cell wall biosynthesis